MLIRKNSKGDWSLCGFDWDDLPKSVRDNKKLMQALYGALLKLKDYEAIGLNPSEIDDIAYKVLDLMHGCHNCPYEKGCKSIKDSGTCWKKIHDFIFGKKYTTLYLEVKKMEIKEFRKLHAEALKVNPSAGLLADLFVQWDDLVEGIRPYVSHSAPIPIVPEETSRKRKGASDEHKGVSVAG